jgi:L-asparaginase II
VLRAGGRQSRVAMGCSGKHAGMLWASRHNGWDLATYLDPAHPLQLALRDTFADLAAEYVADTAVDGCGTPLFSLSLVGLARSFGAISAASADGHGRRLADAVRSHPEWASGTRRDEYALHRAVPGLLAKSGAEAVQAVGLPDGRGVAVKISDGSARARAVAMAGVLQRLGFDHETLTTQAALPVFGGGRPVGAVRPYLPTMRRIGA